MTRQAADTTLRRWIAHSPYSQSDLAEAVGVSRSAVSKWVLGAMYPSTQHAVKLEKISGGEVPASIWPRKTPKEGNTPGARAIWTEARQRGTSIMGLAMELSLPQRSLARWAAGEYRPHAAGVRALNKKLGLKLSVVDFEVVA